MMVSLCKVYCCVCVCVCYVCVEKKIPVKSELGVSMKNWMRMVADQDSWEWLGGSSEWQLKLGISTGAYLDNCMFSFSNVPGFSIEGEKL